MKYFVCKKRKQGNRVTYNYAVGNGLRQNGERALAFVPKWFHAQTFELEEAEQVAAQYQDYMKSKGKSRQPLQIIPSSLTPNPANQ